MKHGFTKVAAAIPGVRVADCNYNITQIQALMLKASEAGAQLVAFPELSVTAYTCMDLFSGKLLLDQAEKALVELVHSTRDLPVLAVVGMPLRTENRLINAAVVFQQGKILGVVPKREAAIIGSTAFFAPLIFTVPDRRLPPRITNFSIRSYPPANSTISPM